jgi:hypothetical protein
MLMPDDHEHDVKAVAIMAGQTSYGWFANGNIRTLEGSAAFAISGFAPP